MLVERRRNPDLAADVRILKDGQERILHLLEGNGRPGFIEETRSEIYSIRTWQTIHEDRRSRAASSNKKMMAYATFFTAAVTAVIHLLVDYIKGK